MTDVGDVYAQYEKETPRQEIARIDTPLDRPRVGGIAVDKFAGLEIREYREAIEFSKLICQARNGIPAFLKGNAADCLIIVTQALRWKLEPVWVMQNSYVAKADGIINYENFLFGAILTASGAIRGRPRYSYDGEGDERTCTVTATFVGERDAHSYTTPPLKTCRPKRNEQGAVKGSPLWDKDPDQQLGYYAIRNFARRYIPELLGGVYSRDEFEDSTQDAVDVTPASPNLMARLPDRVEGAAGFAENVVDKGLAEEAAAQEEQRKARRKAAAEAAEPAQADSKPDPSLETPPPEQPAPEPSLENVDAHQKAPKTAPTPEPQTAEEYMTYAAAWIEKGSNPDNLEARWDGEKEMRAGLKVTTGIVAVRKRLEGMLTARCNALRETKGKKK